MIEIDGVTKIYEGRGAPFTALDNVSVTISGNEFFTLLGPSGCGKTTLLRAIAGFVAPTRGEVRLDGKDMSALPPFRRPVNTVFQSYALFPHMSVAENIGFGLKMLGKPKAEIKSVTDEMLELVRMTPMAGRKTSELSGGQQQRVALARALAPRPRVLLLDEPLSALDFKLRKDMQIELKRLQAETGITFIFVTHDQEEALTMSDRIAVMNAGAIRQTGGAREIYDQPADRFVADFIGETNFIPVELEGESEVRLPSGKMLAVRTPPKGASGKVTLAVRPEHAALCEPAEAALSGVLKNIVYLGTDTQYHIDLGLDAPFVLRRQNQPGAETSLAEGDQVGLSIPGGVAQVLRD